MTSYHARWGQVALLIAQCWNLEIGESQLTRQTANNRKLPRMLPQSLDIFKISGTVDNYRISIAPFKLCWYICVNVIFTYNTHAPHIRHGLVSARKIFEIMPKHRRSAQMHWHILNRAIHMQKFPICSSYLNTTMDCQYICGDFISTSVCHDNTQKDDQLALSSEKLWPWVMHEWHMGHVTDTVI